MKQGFTLLEILVVLIIISIVAALVGLNIGGFMGGAGLKASAKRISISLRYARSEATAQKKPYTAVFDFDQNLFSLSAGREGSVEGEETFVETDTSSSSNQDTAVDGEKSKFKSLLIYRLPEETRFERAILGEETYDSGRFKIVFFPSGNCTGGEITLINDREQRFIIKADFITGMIQLEDASEN